MKIKGNNHLAWHVLLSYWLVEIKAVHPNLYAQKEYRE